MAPAAAAWGVSSAQSAACSKAPYSHLVAIVSSLNIVCRALPHQQRSRGRKMTECRAVSY